jgi:prepilin-type N-terminal cleavage/methylation domain-containing protein
MSLVGRDKKGFTLVELAIVLIVIGILLGLGVALLGPLTKQAQFKRARERVKACKESIIGFVASSRRLPDRTNEFPKICNEKDGWGQSLVYIPDDTLVKYDNTTSRTDLTSGNLCCSDTPDMAVNDRAMTGGTDNYRKDVAFIVFSKGEDRNPNGTWTYNVTIDGTDYASYLIEEYSDTYDDIIEYATVYELRDAIRCEPLKMITGRLPDATEDSSYTANLVASGGCQPYTWSVSDCSGNPSNLPTGLTLSDSAITGTLNLFGGPTGSLDACSASTNTFTLSVQDGAGSCEDNTFSIVVRPQELMINTISLPEGTIDMPYSTNIIGSGGNITSYNFTIGGLPSGLNASAFSDCNGDGYNECSQITGTPTGNCGDYSVTVQLSDGCSTTSKAYNLHLYKLISCSLSSTDNGDGTYDITYTITNGPVNGVFSPQSGTCTTFSNSNGGTCTTAVLTGDTTFVLAIADGCGESAKCQITILTGGGGGGNCSTPLSLTPPDGSIFNATVGIWFSQTITVSGGLSPYINTTCTNNCNTYGLNLNCTSTGATLSGTPNSSGTCTFTVGWQDSCNPPNATSGTYTVNIASACNPFTGWGSNLPQAQNCQPYSGSVTVIGGEPDYTWSISPSPIMNGLTDCNGQIGPSTTCSITGTPLDDPGNSPYSFTVQVTDSCSTGSQNTSNTFSIALAPDNCYNGGVRFRNDTGADRGYKQNGGACQRWRDGRDIRVRPGEQYEIFEDRNCNNQCIALTDYCDQKSYDNDGDCRTRLRDVGGNPCTIQDR